MRPATPTRGLHGAILSLAATGVGAAMNGGSSPDGDQPGFARIGFDDVPRPCQFLETQALRDEYAARGVLFDGPGPFDGGAALDRCAFFLVQGISPPAFIGLNEDAAYPDGGIPIGPQEILFDEPVHFVSVRVGAFIADGSSVTLTAYDGADRVVGTDTVPVAPHLDTMVVEAPDIVRATVETSFRGLVIDDLTFGDSSGGALSAVPRSLAISVPAGGRATGAITFVNASADAVSAFIRERTVEPLAASGRAAAPPVRSIELGRDPWRATRPLNAQPAAGLGRGEDRVGRVSIPSTRVDRSASGVGTGAVSAATGGSSLEPPRILIWTEPDVDDLQPETDLDLALRWLGLPYEAVYAGGVTTFFLDALQSEAWDLVIFDHALASFFEFEFIVYDALAEYVAGGGRAIIGSWQMGEVAENLLWSELGVSWQANYEDVRPVRWLDPADGLFTLPNDVPEFLEPLEAYVIDGAEVDVLSGAGAEVVAVLESQDDAGAPLPALVRANDGRTLFRAYVDGSNIADLDDDGILDTIEWWRNAIIDVLGEDLPWLALPREFTVAGGDALELTLSVDAADLAPGEYVVELVIRTNEAIFRDLAVLVTVTVTEATPACPADLNASGAVDFADLVSLLGAWGPCPGCVADLDGNGLVGIDDLLGLLTDFGPCPEAGG